MTKKNLNETETGDLESRVTMLEDRITALERLSKKFTRKKREYTDEQRAAIRARLLAGQEAARKRREDNVAVISMEKTTTPTKKVVKAKPKSTPEKS